jgi:phenylacetate-CoA ligase
MRSRTAQIRSLYYSLPFAAKNLVASAYGLNERRVRYGKTYTESLALLRKSQYWSNERLIDFQHERLQKFLQNVIEQTPYYRSRDPYRDLLKRNAALDSFPIITKTDLRRETTSFYHDDFRSMRCRWAHTSGTTGSAILFPIGQEDFQHAVAFRALAYEWGGISLTGGDKVAICAGHRVVHPDIHRPPFWVHDLANGWLYFSSYHLTRQNLRHYISELEKFKPVMLTGYPSSLYLLALGYEQFGGNLKLRSIFTSSETLLGWQRAKIESAFGAKVFDYYGLAENCAHIVECERSELHLKLEHSLVEILNERGTPCSAGETGRLVCTAFNSYAFPLIRYEIGDEVVISQNQTAKCGRRGLLIERILGRIEDYILTHDGRLIGRLDHLFKESANVEEAQIYQESVNEIVCRIVRTDNYKSEDERAIREEARSRLGTSTKIKFEYLDRIPRGRNGKFCFVVSRLNNRGSQLK